MYLFPFIWIYISLIKCIKANNEKLINEIMKNLNFLFQKRNKY